MARIPTPVVWARLRAQLGCLPAVAIVPKDNIILGHKNICDYLGIVEIRVLERWVDEFALPMVKRPDGIWMTSITAIDQWINMAAMIAYENKSKAGKTWQQLGKLKEERRKLSKDLRTATSESSKAEVERKRAALYAAILRQKSISGPPE